MQPPLIFSKSTSVGIFYKAGDGKVIKCRWKKLQNYDILSEYSGVKHKARLGRWLVHDVACLRHGANEFGIVRFTLYLFS